MNSTTNASTPRGRHVIIYNLMSFHYLLSLLICVLLVCMGSKVVRQDAFLPVYRVTGTVQYGDFDSFNSSGVFFTWIFAFISFIISSVLFHLATLLFSARKR